MKETLSFINSLVRDSNPDNYGSISYNKYYKDLSNISDSLLEEISKIKEEIMKVDDPDLRAKILSLL